MRFAGIVIYAPICVLLLLLTVAQAKPQGEGGRCMAAQQRLAKLRAEIEGVEQEVDAACAAVATDAPHVVEKTARARATFTSTFTATTTAHVAGAQALITTYTVGMPYTASRAS